MYKAEDFPLPFLKLCTIQWESLHILFLAFFVANILSTICFILWFPSQSSQAPHCCLAAPAGEWLSNVLSTASLLHTHASQTFFSVTLSSCITCISIRLLVPCGLHSGLKTCGELNTSAPRNCDLPSLLLWREHWKASKVFFFSSDSSLKLASNMKH